MSRLSPVVVALSLLAALAATPAEAALRAFVSSTGMDSNTATGCGVGAPCRSFASAQTVVSAGGEIIALDAAGYGAITITKSVTITANPGFYAGIAVPSGNGVTIATAGVNVILRGLNIHGTGGTNGIAMTDGALLSIENCVISSFSNDGVIVTAPSAPIVRIVDTLIRDNGTDGVFLDQGATATISGSRILGNGNAGFNVAGTTAATTTAAISDTTVTGSGAAIASGSSNAGAVTQVFVTRSTVASNLIGILVNGAAGASLISIGDSMVTGNPGAGFNQSGVGTLETLGNNIVRQNGADVGTVTTVSLR